ncbi:restriction endonuclease subunit S [Desulfobulbus sp.]|uniref:restriction endonuclease subunit S n=1 Tax=Desulfobulbus sp. TaxID=895 RepID=UPI0027B94A7B|nr:restriction endonuclease subunit S [Desulfobulbus sp.]
MSSDWNKTRLSELIEVKHGWAFKGEYIVEGLSKGPIVVAIGNFDYSGGFRFDYTRIKRYAGVYPKEYELNAEEILLAMTCQTAGGEILGIPGRIPNDGKLYLHNQRLGRVIIKDKNLVDDEFLYWLFISKNFKNHLFNTATGTKILHTSPERITSYEFYLPCINEQRLIGQLLKCFANKITSNCQANQTLEEITQAIFKSWFVDFEPVKAKIDAKANGQEPERAAMCAISGKSDDELDRLSTDQFSQLHATASLFPDELIDSEQGLIPKGWERTSIYTICDVIYGAPFKSKLFNNENIGVPLIRIRDLKNEVPGVYTDEIHSKGYMVTPGDLLVGMDGEFRPYLWGGENAWLNQRVCCFKAKEQYSTAFLIFTISPQLAHIEATETATTVIHLGKGDIDCFHCILPPVALISIFNNLANSLFEEIVVLKRESTSLAQLRDALLPKLLSGEIDLQQMAV